MIANARAAELAKLECMDSGIDESAHEEEEFFWYRQLWELDNK